ncbi:hypothetical protein WJX72_004573 [[Myrmecia] bisecta]|uniref:SnoaL-like domain-containing protein n=1 Tax=[Myrmecia] bisecta TaxID=41462 RepID=A0AAW1R6S9_9CHLO
MEVVKDGYAKFSVGDIAGFLDLVHDDMEWEVHDVTAPVPFAGHLSGKPAVIKFFEHLKSFQIFKYEVQAFYGKGSEIAAVGQLDAKTLTTGKEYHGDWLQVWKIKDGKIASWDEFYQNPENLVAAYTDDA